MARVPREAGSPLPLWMPLVPVAPVPLVAGEMSRVMPLPRVASVPRLSLWEGSEEMPPEVRFRSEF